MNRELGKRVFDPEERTARLGEAVMPSCKTTMFTVAASPHARQLVRFATSIRANWCKPDDAVVGNEFGLKIRPWKLGEGNKSWAENAERGLSGKARGCPDAVAGIQRTPPDHLLDLPVGIDKEPSAAFRLECEFALGVDGAFDICLP